MPVIIGVDPGSRHTGYGIIQAANSQLRCMTFGVIDCPSKLAMPDRLHIIFEKLTEVLQQYQPEQAAIEEVFMHQNVSSALKLGQARGAALVGLAKAGLSVAEYTARQIKQSVVGYGAADKHQMQQMIRHLLRLTRTPATDAADALAVAICHHHNHHWQQKIAKAKQQETSK